MTVSDLAARAAQKRASADHTDPEQLRLKAQRLDEAARERLTVLQGTTIGRLKALKRDVPMNLNKMTYSDLLTFSNSLLPAALAVETSSTAVARKGEEYSDNKSMPVSSFSALNSAQESENREPAVAAAQARAPPELTANTGEHIQHIGQKPRAFYNIMRERFGGGSCWINAAIQAALSPEAFKVALTTQWVNLERSTQERLLRLIQSPRRIGNAGQTVFPSTSQVRLAATFCSAHRDPRTQPLNPYLFTDSWYVGAQDDASQFLSRILHPDEAPSLAQLLGGHMDQFLECTNPGCGHVRATTGESFSSVQLPLKNIAGGVVRTVQEALDAYMPREQVSLDEPCHGCHQVQNYWKTHKVTRFRQVLMVSLNRWAHVGVESAILHPVEASELLHFKERHYRLCSVVCHLGPAPSAGHYIAVSRHATNHGEWWLYDDERRVIATPEQISTIGSYGDAGPVQSYVLFYELCDANSQRTPAPADTDFPSGQSASSSAAPATVILGEVPVSPGIENMPSER